MTRKVKSERGSAGRSNGRDQLLILSGLSRRYEGHGVNVEICIFRLPGEHTWSLDAYTEGGDCVAWNSTFETEQAALAAFIRVLTEEGGKRWFQATSTVGLT